MVAQFSIRMSSFVAALNNDSFKGNKKLIRETIDEAVEHFLRKAKILKTSSHNYFEAKPYFANFSLMIYLRVLQQTVHSGTSISEKLRIRFCMLLSCICLPTTLTYIFYFQIYYVYLTIPPISLEETQLKLCQTFQMSIGKFLKQCKNSGSSCEPLFDPIRSLHDINEKNDVY